MKIRSVTANRRRHRFDMVTTTGLTLTFPFALLTGPNGPTPSADDPVYGSLDDMLADAESGRDEGEL